MSSITLVGYGTRGKLYKQILKELGHTTRAIIDKKLTHSKLWDCPKTDFFIISLPPDQNFVALDFYLEHSPGSLILVDKPPALSYMQAKQFLPEQGRIMVIFPERFNPAINEVMDFGHPLEIYCHRHGPPPYWSNIISPMMDLSIHDRDMVKFVYGINNKIPVKYDCGYGAIRERFWMIGSKEKGTKRINLMSFHNGLQMTFKSFLNRDWNNSYKSFVQIVKELEESGKDGHKTTNQSD